MESTENQTVKVNNLVITNFKDGELIKVNEEKGRASLMLKQVEDLMTDVGGTLFVTEIERFAFLNMKADFIQKYIDKYQLKAGVNYNEAVGINYFLSEIQITQSEYDKLNDEEKANWQLRLTRDSKTKELRKALHDGELIYKKTIMNNGSKVEDEILSVTSTEAYTSDEVAQEEAKAIISQAK